MQVPWNPKAIILFLPDGEHSEEVSLFLGHLTLPVVAVRVVSDEESIKVENVVEHFASKRLEGAHV